MELFVYAYATVVDFFDPRALKTVRRGCAPMIQLTHRNIWKASAAAAVASTIVPRAPHCG
jgi:hypothetical protein